MENTKHIIRAVLLVVVVIVLFILGRHFAVPESFGEHGHFRFTSISEFEAQEPTHGDRGDCTACHDEESEIVLEGAHATVTCELCHGPLGGHVEGEQHIAAMPVNRNFELCAWCHARLRARPAEFPQVVVEAHVTEQGQQLVNGVCLECHDAHNPSE